ncbi:MAG: SHOCT domain-containing protein [Desulfobacterales bacterium]|nr:SHOCT domain-containing protein [Deltaproteobacteria bacterium]MBT8372178.1 SHOCT domain-containing protein [Deltaproteobacteria bacterium]NNL78546.1 SHOCT domain-containing protein [Desulfobacterales bacterium]
MESTRTTFKFGLVPVLIAFIMTTIMPILPTEAQAGEGAAFLGGMVAGHLVSGAVRRSRIRTAAAVEAASQPKTQTVYVQQPATTTSAHTAQAAKSSTEDRLKELDKLAAGGYITPEEYKAKKKAILDSI